MKARAAAVYLLASLACGCLAEPASRLPLNMEPTERNDGWALSNPAAEGLDGNKLNMAYKEFFENDSFLAAASFIVIRHGKIVAEGYSRDMGDASRLSNLQSATMSVTSMLTGIAIDQKLLGPVTQPAAKVLPDYFINNKADITLEDLLTMRSGLHWENEQTRQFFTDPPVDTLALATTQLLDFEPGSRFHFSDGQAHLVGGIIETATGESLADYGYRTLFHPLGIENFIWEQAGDGVTFGAFGLYLTPRDFAKLGQLYLQNGKWAATQIVSANWVTASTTARTNFNAGPFGYFWRVRPDLKAYAAVGKGGQILYVIPDLDLVLVETANPNSDGTLQVTLSRFEDLARLVIDSVLTPP